jgi:hypothetical protein
MVLVVVSAMLELSEGMRRGKTQLIGLTCCFISHHCAYSRGCCYALALQRCSKAIGSSQDSSESGHSSVGRFLACDCLSG